MSASIKEVLRIYNTKPKKPRKPRKLKPLEKVSPEKAQEKRTRSNEPVQQLTSSHRRMHSVDPAIRKYLDEYRNYSYTHLPQSQNLDDSLEHLQALVDRSRKVRTSRLSVQMKVLQLEVSGLVAGGKLRAIEEIDDFALEDPLQAGFTPADTLAQKYELQCDERLKNVQ